MKELWVKKTVYRRYLIEDDEIEEVKAILTDDSTYCIDVIRDHYDKNEQVEYDDEDVVLPIEYSISALANEA
ncbi:hypothetical protein RPMD05_18 [Rhodobacteraceae phage LS06-2018-MD05]|nr:hypothetical protein RPMD05_18 [Rhodobacteraceae phage LS06-2018-MD05]